MARCDKCDGKHATAACPHFRKARETHPDAQRGGKSGLGGLGGTPTRSSNPRLVADPAMVGCSRLAAPASGRQAACRCGCFKWRRRHATGEFKFIYREYCCLDSFRRFQPQQQEHVGIVRDKAKQC